MTSHLVILSRERPAQTEGQGLYKRERLINGAQAGRIRVTSQTLECELVNRCANKIVLDWGA
jgi:glycine C-acetyltransferase